MPRKKTGIVQSYGKLTALLSALEALRECFGKKLEFLNSDTRQADKEIPNYEVEIRGEFPMRMGNMESDTPVIFHAFVTLALKRINSNLRSDGPVKIKIMGWDQVLEIWNFENPSIEGRYFVADSSKLSLRQLKEQMFHYHVRR